MLGLVGLRHEQSNVLADHLLGGVTEGLFRATIKSEDQACIIDDDDLFTNLRRRGTVATDSHLGTSSCRTPILIEKARKNRDSRKRSPGCEAAPRYDTFPEPHDNHMTTPRCEYYTRAESLHRPVMGDNCPMIEGNGFLCQ